MQLMREICIFFCNFIKNVLICIVVIIRLNIFNFWKREQDYWSSGAHVLRTLLDFPGVWSDRPFYYIPLFAVKERRKPVTIHSSFTLLFSLRERERERWGFGISWAQAWNKTHPIWVQWRTPAGALTNTLHMQLKR